MAPEGEGRTPRLTPGSTVTRTWVRVAAALFAIGYGANQFSPLMVLYRERGHYSAVTVAAFFGVYAAGLAPGLLLGGPASDRWGRRRLAVPALAVSVPASAVLALGGVPMVSEAALYTGRFLFGVVTGIAMAVGTTWVKELSQPPWDPGADQGAGARRAALALSAGFGAGPLMADRGGADRPRARRHGTGLELVSHVGARPRVGWCRGRRRPSAARWPAGPGRRRAG